MSDRLDHVGLTQGVEGNRDAPDEIAAGLAICLPVQPLFPHCQHSHIIGSDRDALPEHVAAAAADLISAEVGTADSRVGSM